MSLSLPRWALWLLCCATPLPALAETQVTRLEDNVYSIHMELTVAASVPRVRALLTDYEHLERVNPAIRESALLAVDGADRFRVRTVTRSCVTFMCFDMTQVQDVLEKPDGEIIATDVPGQGDFSEGVALWRILPGDIGTRIIFEARMKPDFWVPPLIGTWMIERQIDRQAALTAEYLNRLDSELAMR